MPENGRSLRVTRNEITAWSSENKLSGVPSRIAIDYSTTERAVPIAHSTFPGIRAQK
jgi:hypothetical protein